MIQTTKVLNGEVKRTEGLARTAEKADNSFGSYMVLKISSRGISDWTPRPYYREIYPCLDFL